ncbi:MAG: HEAT repeat domain-containing protein [Pyrinomonadaceae bacterium]|nr:HEAT repeat domain-containing protein [Pyrinomonadaceae bacterium]
MAKAGEVQPLIRAIEGHPNNEVRLAVVKLLALSGQKEILPAFRRLAVRGSLPTEVRSAVMEAIYQISSSQPTVA